MFDRLILGCGYLGRRVAKSWREDGLSVAAVTRSVRRAEEMRAIGLEPIVGDVLDRGSLRNLPAAKTVLYAVGYDFSAARSRREVFVNGLHNVLQSLRGKCERIIYISSTSVFGQQNGEWVDEDSATKPDRETGQLLLEAEGLLREFGNENSTLTHILRLAGIYGPSRLLTKVEALRAGEPLAGNPDAWLNLIHVDDARRAARAVESIDDSGTWIVSDNEPVRRAEYYSHLAALIDAAPPEFDPAKKAARVSARGLNKRCRNDRLKRETGWSPEFANYRDGLPASI